MALSILNDLVRREFDTKLNLCTLYPLEKQLNPPSPTIEPTRVSCEPPIMRDSVDTKSMSSIKIKVKISK